MENNKKSLLRAWLRTILCLIFWFLIWWALALAVSRAVVLPTPFAVAKRIAALLPEPTFWRTCASSLVRIFAGLLLGLFTGILLAALSVCSRVADALLTPLITVVKATPVASVILLMLFILGKNAVPVIAAWLMVIPIVYMNGKRGIESVPREQKEVAQIYRLGFGKRLKTMIIPAFLPYFSAACRSALGLAWKAGIAAEVICSPDHSIGGMLSDAKIYLESEDLYAWTVIVILLSILIEKGLVALLAHFTQKEGNADATV